MMNSKIAARAKLFILALFLTRVSASAQDVITLRNGEQIKANVLEISASEIRYKRFEHLEGPTIVIPRSDVFAINYENGTREVINPFTSAAAQQGQSQSTQQEQAREQPVVQMQAETNRAQPTREQSVTNPAYYRFYTGLTVGNAVTGPILGLKGAYFFNHMIGAGFTLRSNVGMAVNSTFFGPVFYGHWGRINGNFFFPTAIGFGLTTYADVEDPRYRITLPAIFISPGMAYKPTNFLSIGLNFEIGGGGFLGYSAGVNFHF